MSGAQHTPGPWEAEGPLKPGPAWRIRSPRGLVCYVGDPVTASYDRANARLIAAAPDMLTALKALEDQGLLQALIDMDSSIEDDEEPIAASAVKAIKAAIAKAEGRS